MKKTNEPALPPIYERKGRQCYLDFIRQKLIYITPEETVRQTIISYLLNELKIPREVISVEQHLSHYGINTKKRADIVIHKIDSEGNFHPVAIIECKAPNVYLDEKAEKQILDYCDLIGADYAMLTNGDEQRCLKYDEKNDNYFLIENLPTYKDILSDKYVEFDIGEFPPRIKFSEIKDYLEKKFKSYEKDYYGEDISKLTPLELAVPVFNLWEGLLDVRIKMPVGDYGLFKLIEDYGVRMLSYGNASGGKFFGPYRSFLVDVNGCTEFYSIGVTTYSNTNPEKVKTCIAVAHDDEKDTHHALQLVVDDNLVAVRNRVDFYHHGKIAIGNKGSGKIDELRMFVDEKYPQIIRGTKFYLGSLVNDRLWSLNDPEVINLIVNLISYAMIRDEYRDYVKNK